MNQQRFLNYVLDFHGHGGIQDIGATRTEILEACLVRFTDRRYRKTPWGADTLDREIVRDIILERREESEREDIASAQTIVNCLVDAGALRTTN